MSIYWDETQIHVMDFEGSLRSGIVEYGIVSLRGKRIEGVATRLCRPAGKIPSSERETHGIDAALAAAQSPFSDEWERFAGLREKGAFAAHFAHVENYLLKSVFPYPRASPDWLSKDRQIAEWGPWIDTGILYQESGSKEESRGLAELVARHGLQEELDELAAKYCPSERQRYHCALYDALACAMLLILHCQELASQRPTLRQLAIDSQASPERRADAQQGDLFG